jgi:hypothetical protein
MSTISSCMRKQRQVGHKKARCAQPASTTMRRPVPGLHLIEHVLFVTWWNVILNYHRNMALNNGGRSKWRIASLTKRSCCRYGYGESHNSAEILRPHHYMVNLYQLCEVIFGEHQLDTYSIIGNALSQLSQAEPAMRLGFQRARTTLLQRCDFRCLCSYCHTLSGFIIYIAAVAWSV